MSDILASKHRVEKVTGPELERLQNFFTYTDGAIRLQPGNWIFPTSFSRHANRIYNFKVKPSDIYVVAIPKSGINWMQEIVWNLVHNPDLDNPEAEETIDSRCPFYEIDFFFEITGTPPIDPNGEIMKKFNKLFPGKDPSEGVFTHLADYSPEPRLIKNHLPCCFLPPDMFKMGKIIYLARDPRDAILSFYHVSKFHLMMAYNGTLEEFVEDYINDHLPYTPYWEHVRLAWEKRNDPNFLFVFYEDLKANPKSEIKRIDQFLGTNRTDKQIDNIVRYTEFSSMKERTKANPPTSFDNSYLDKDSRNEGASYFRKGQVGSWKEEFSPQMKEKVNAWMRKNLTQFGEDFKYNV